MAIDRNLVSNILTGILVLCAVTVTALSVHQYLSARSEQAQAPTHISDWQHLVANRSANIGSNQAILKIIEFSDYQCPFCKALEPNLQALIEKNSNKVAVVRYDFPLKDIHEYAYKAAIASKCAEAQGIYEAFETELFQTNLAKVDWAELARQAKVPDVSQFTVCVDKNITAPLVDADIKVANEIGIKETPTLVINGAIVPGMKSNQELSKLISENE